MWYSSQQGNLAAASIRDLFYWLRRKLSQSICYTQSEVPGSRGRQLIGGTRVTLPAKALEGGRQGERKERGRQRERDREEGERERGERDKQKE